ncbi:hypothetical protein, partial [Ralstonia pseudosolanacearum]
LPQFIADLLSCHANNNAQPPAFDDLVLLAALNVTGASGKASDYVAERHANQPSTEQATQRPAARSAGQGVLQGLQRQNSASRHSDTDAESAIQYAVTQARLGDRFRPGPLPEQKELIGPKIGRSD